MNTLVAIKPTTHLIIAKMGYYDPSQMILFWKLNPDNLHMSFV